MSEIIEIPLSGELVAVVDKGQEWVLEGPKWQASKTQSGRIYVKRMLKSKGTVTYQYLHRLICNAPKGMVVDHINRNPLDNRKENLRLVTTQQNSWNRVGVGGGFKGVIKHKYGFCARLMINGKGVHLGFFKSAVDAAKRYDEAAKHYFGQFALTNEDLGKFESNATYA